MENNYDSTADTLAHIKRVSDMLGMAATMLIERGRLHDKSKLESPEKEEFDRLTPKLKTLVYDTPEYKESLGELQVALKHHYEHNTHHPEHHIGGIDGMTLFDVIEMFFDWKAATERTKDGDIYKSVEINAKRFEISDQLANIFYNTLDKFVVEDNKIFWNNNDKG